MAFSLAKKISIKWEKACSRLLTTGFSAKFWTYWLFRNVHQIWYHRRYIFNLKAVKSMLQMKWISSHFFFLEVILYVTPLLKCIAKVWTYMPKGNESQVGSVIRGEALMKHFIEKFLLIIFQQHTHTQTCIQLLNIKVSVKWQTA